MPPMSVQKVNSPQKSKTTAKENRGEEAVNYRRARKTNSTVISVLTFFIGILVGYIIWGTGLVAPNAQAAESADAVLYKRFNIPVDGFYSQGPDNAPITLVEFSDYQCPFCQRWHDEVFQPLLAAYPDKIKFVYRNMPLVSLHPDAFSAAEAAMCAGDQNAYWQYHDKLLSGTSLGNDVYLRYAQELGLNTQAFSDCISSHKFKDKIQKDSQFGASMNVTGTPTFFLNGIRVVGAQPLSYFKDLIDKELAGELPK